MFALPHTQTHMAPYVRHHLLPFLHLLTLPYPIPTPSFLVAIPFGYSCSRPLPTCAVHECKSPFSLFIFYFFIFCRVCVCFVFRCSLLVAWLYQISLCIPLSLLRSICIRPSVCLCICVSVYLCGTVAVSRAGSACKNSKIAPTRCAMVEHPTSL